MGSFFDPSLFLQLSSEQHKNVVYNHTFDILQDAPHNLALVLKVWTSWQILAFFKKTFNFLTYILLPEQNRTFVFTLKLNFTPKVDIVVKFRVTKWNRTENPAR